MTDFVTEIKNNKPLLAKIDQYLAELAVDNQIGPIRGVAVRHSRKKIKIDGQSYTLIFVRSANNEVKCIVMGKIIGVGSFGETHLSCVYPFSNKPEDFALKKFVVKYGNNASLNDEEPFRYQTKSMANFNEHASLLRSNPNTIENEYRTLKHLGRAKEMFSIKHTKHVRIDDEDADIEIEKAFILMNLEKGISFSDILYPTKSVADFKYILNNKELVLRICEAILVSVNELHAKNVIHNDFKLENMLLEISPEGQVKINIVDFGVSYTLSDKSDIEEKLIDLKDIITTQCYCSPESTKGRMLSNKSDLYSIGICLYRLLSQDRTTTESVLISDDRLKTRESPLKYIEKYYGKLVLDKCFSPSVYALLEMMLHPDRKVRFSPLQSLNYYRSNIYPRKISGRIESTLEEVTQTKLFAQVHDKVEMFTPKYVRNLVYNILYSIFIPILSILDGVWDLIYYSYRGTMDSLKLKLYGQHAYNVGRDEMSSPIQGPLEYDQNELPEPANVLLFCNVRKPKPRSDSSKKSTVIEEVKTCPPAPSVRGLL